MPEAAFGAGLLLESAVMGLPHPFRQLRTAVALDRAERLGVKGLRSLQLTSLQALLEYASVYCPYYVDTLRPHLDRMGSIRSLEQLEELPVVTRDDVRQNSTEMCDYRRRSELRRGSTGGTTGTPMPFYTDGRFRMASRAHVARLYRTMGRRAFTRTVLMAGSPIDVQRWTDLRREVVDWLRRTTVIPAFSLSTEMLPSIVSLIRRRKPEFLMCYTSALTVLARYCESSGDALRLPAVVPLAELVTETHRQKFLNVFGAETYEIYGAREATGMAVECFAHAGLHIQEDAYILEFARAGSPAPAGEPGEVLVTDLRNLAMPLIRYQIGDVGRKRTDPCPCGRAFALMDVTHGRVLDVIVGPGGTLLPGEYFPHLFKEVDRDVEAFQVWQPTIDTLDISMKVRRGARDDLEHYLGSHIAGKLGPNVQIRFRRVEELTGESSGKWRPTRSDVPLPWSVPDTTPRAG